MHLECDNYTEAAYSLKLHSQLLAWSDQPLSPLLISHRWHYRSELHNLSIRRILYCCTLSQISIVPDASWTEGSIVQWHHRLLWQRKNVGMRSCRLQGINIAIRRRDIRLLAIICIIKTYGKVLWLHSETVKAWTGILQSRILW